MTCGVRLFEDDEQYDLIDAVCVVEGVHEVHADGVEWKWDGRTYWYEVQR